MASLFRKFKKKLPVSTSKNSTYYKRENAIGNSTDLMRILSGAPEAGEYATSKTITFNTLPLKEITLAGLKKQFGNPSFIYENDMIDGHKVLFYKDSVAYYKFLVQYHFINGKFFFAANKISSMGVLSDEDKIKIIQRITKKYLDREYAPEFGWHVKVKDPDGSIIYTIDDVYFHIYYLAGNEATLELLKKYEDQIPQEKKPSGFKESLDQYI